MTIVGTGVRLEASGGRAQDPRVEISTLNLSGYAGSTVARTGVGTNGVSFLSTTTGLPIAENAAGFTSAPVNLTGSSAIDVLDVQAPGQFITHWNNNTRGELVRLNNDGGTIGRINSLGAVGSAMSSTGAQIFLTGGDPTAAVQMRNPDMGIFSSGILSIDSRTSVANVSVFGFTGIGRITANSGGTDEPGVFEGITGPIYSLGPIDLVQIGEGVASTGSGDIFFGGIFGEGQIGRVEGRGGDIYGFVASNTGIDRIDLENGSLIDTTIGVYSGPFAQLRPLFTRALVDDDTGSTNNPSFEIDQITVRGNGGIIGAVIQAADIRDIVADQFFFTSVVSSEGGGFFDRISVGGYGIRNVLINAGSSLRKLEATGRGGTMATSSISQSVRRSEFEAINSFTSRGASVLNDIHAVLGTSAAITTIPGITETGIIEDVVATGNGTLGQVTAYQIRGSQPGVTDSRFAFGNSIGLIKTRSLINGLIVDTGRLSRFEPAGDVLALDLKVAGKIGRLRIRGSLADNSVISTTGPNGVISELRVDGNFEGTISATGRVTRIIIRGDLTEGSIIINPTNPSRRALDLLSVGGDLRASSINVTGNIGEIRTAGSLGIEGEAGTLTINGSLTRLRVGTDRSRTSVMWLGLDVNGGSVGTIDVRGRIDGAINVDGDIRSLVVRNNGLAGPDILVDPINTGGRILRATFAGGNLTAAVTAFGDIRSFVVSGGSLQSGANIISTTGSIGSITVRGGEMLSSVSTTQRLGSLFVDGNIGNTGTTANISAASVGRLTTRANLFSDVSVAGRLDNLTIAGNLEADSRVSANSIRRQSIRGAINGEVVIA